MKHGDAKRDEAFDYVVNATYANRNLLAKLFGFPVKPLRFDLLELLLLEIPLPKMSVTILDGPFTSLVSMGEDNLFTLSHIQHSVLATETPSGRSAAHLGREAVELGEPDVARGALLAGAAAMPATSARAMALAPSMPCRRTSMAGRRSLSITVSAAGRFSAARSTRACRMLAKLPAISPRNRKSSVQPRRRRAGNR